MSTEKNNDFEPDWNDMEFDWLDDIFKNDPPEARPKPKAAAKPPVTKTPRSEAKPSAPAQEPVRRQARTEPAPRAYRSYEDEEPVRRRTPAQRAPVRRMPEDAELEYEARGRRDRRGGSNRLFIVLIAVLAAGLIFAAWQLGSIFLNYHRDRSAYDELANRAIVELAEDPTLTESGDETGTATAGQRIFSEVPISVDWEYLRSINSSIVGWLYCPDTIVNYPVVQTIDQEFYLDHGFDGNPNTSGTLFVDGSSVLGVTQSNYIIYGHNMKDESMFGTFKNYANQSYYDMYPTMYYLTPNGNYRIDLICAHVVESTYDNFPGYFSTIEDYQTYLNLIMSQSLWTTYSTVSTDYQLLTLSTCTSSAGFEDARLVLHGMMVPIQ